MPGTDTSQRQAQERKKVVMVRLSPALVSRLDSYCGQQRAKPSRTAVIEAAILDFLGQDEPESSPAGRA